MDFSKKPKETNAPDSTNKSSIGRLPLFDKIYSYFAGHSYAYLFFAFLLPAFLMLLTYAVLGVYPFGKSSVLVLDLNGQYVQFFAGLRSLIYGDGSFLYSFSRSLGGEFLGIYAYYLASPFSYIVALFPKDNILEALLTIFVLKCGASGLTFGIYIKYSQKLNKTITVLLCTLYALCSYSVVMHHNTMWIDAMIILPLLVLGVERLIKYKKPLIYVLSLALTLMVNYYIGYMSCIFVLLYFFYYVLSTICTSSYNPLGEKHHFLRSISRIALYSVLGIGIAAIILIPAYYSLTFGKTEFTTPDFAFTSKFDFVDFLAKLFPGSYDTVRPEGLPWVYSGVLSVLLLPLYFVAKKITWQEKLASGVLLIVLFASMNINTFDLIWHGFQAPNWLNYRYSFMFSFVVLVLSGRAITLLRDIGYKSILASCTISAIIIIVLQKLNLTCNTDGKEFEFFNDLNGVWLSLACIAIYGSVLMLMSNHPASSEKIGILALVLILTVSCELFINVIYSTKMLDKDVVISNYESYHGFYDIHEDAVDSIKDTEKDSFYRVEKTFTRNVTDSFVWDVNGIASSTSTLDRDTINFIRLMGIKADSHWSEYKGSTLVSDSFFGIKYLMTLPNEIPPSLYELTYSDEHTNVYKNPYALSLLFATSSSVNDVDFDLPQDVEDYDYVTDEQAGTGSWQLKPEFSDTLWNPFQRMNAMLSAIIDEDVSVYEPIEHTMKTTITVNQTDNLWSHYEFSAEKDDMSACVTFNLKAPRNGEIYCYFPTKYAREAKIFLNQKMVETIYPGNANNSIIINLGNFSEGEALMVDMYIYPYGEFYLISEAPYFYYIDENEFTSVFSRISDGNITISEFSDDFIRGEITVDDTNTTVLSTIPYDSGWNVTVDGEKVETYETLSSLLAFDLPRKGTYQITMKYFPSCYKAAIIITAVSSFIFAFLMILSALAKKGKISFNNKKTVYNLADTFISLPTDTISAEISVMELEAKALEEKKENLKKRNKKTK